MTAFGFFRPHSFLFFAVHVAPSMRICGAIRMQILLRNAVHTTCSASSAIQPSKELDAKMGRLLA